MLFEQYTLILKRELISGDHGGVLATDGEGCDVVPWNDGFKEFVTHWMPLPDLPGEAQPAAGDGQPMSYALRDAWGNEYIVPENVFHALLPYMETQEES